MSRAPCAADLAVAIGAEAGFFAAFFSAMGSPGLLHAVFGPIANLVAVELEAALNVKSEPAPVLRDPLLLPRNLEDEHVPRLVDHAAVEVSLGRVRGADHLDAQLDAALLGRAPGGASVLQGPCQLIDVDVPDVQPLDDRHRLSVPARVVGHANHLLLLRDLLAHTELVREAARRADRHQVASLGSSFGAAAGFAVPSFSSSRMIVRMRAMFFRNARIFPGFGGAPPIAATPRSCISSSWSSVSFFASVSASIARISFVRRSGI